MYNGRKSCIDNKAIQLPDDIQEPVLVKTLEVSWTIDKDEYKKYFVYKKQQLEWQELNGTCNIRITLDAVGDSRHV